MGPATPDSPHRSHSRTLSLNEGRPGGAGNPLTNVLGLSINASALNEGRPGGAGNPWPSDSMSTPSVLSAQRRPARWGRQPLPLHLRCQSAAAALNEGRPGGAGNPPAGIAGSLRPQTRSTKAGPVGPATLYASCTAR